MNKQNVPVIESSLSSAYATASGTDIKPDSENKMVALMTGSMPPASVILASASATPEIRASSKSTGKSPAGGSLYEKASEKSFLRLNVTVLRVPVREPLANAVDVIVRGAPGASVCLASAR